MVCPFLVEDEDRCKANIYRVIYGQTGKKVEYEPLTPTEAQKCRNPELYPKCPDYITSNKETCPNCGYVYLPEDVTKISIDGELMSVCPVCGSTKRRR